eukprot:8535021-Pyramimonas_sp.AAC.2
MFGHVWSRFVSCFVGGPKDSSRFTYGAEGIGLGGQWELWRMAPGGRLHSLRVSGRSLGGDVFVSGAAPASSPHVPRGCCVPLGRAARPP